MLLNNICQQLCQEDYADRQTNKQSASESWRNHLEQVGGHGVETRKFCNIILNVAHSNIMKELLLESKHFKYHLDKKCK